MRVAEAAARVNSDFVVGPPKNHLRRHVLLPRFLVDELVAVVDGKAPRELVFPASQGGFIKNEAYRQLFAKVRPDARMTPHDLRHTAASLAIQASANVKAVQRMLGHKTATMTLDLYGHLFEDDLDLLARRLHESAAYDLRTVGEKSGVVPLRGAG